MKDLIEFTMTFHVTKSHDEALVLVFNSDCRCRCTVRDHLDTAADEGALQINM